MEDRLEDLIHSPQTEEVTMKAIDSAKRCVIPKTVRELLSLKVGDYVHVEYVFPKESIQEMSKVTYDQISDYHQVKDNHKIAINNLAKHVLHLEQGNLFNVKFRRVYLTKTHE